MKKVKRIAFTILIVIVIGLSCVVYSSIDKDTTDIIREKTFSEIQYFESKILYMFNSLNNIEFENYKLSIEDISENSKKTADDNSKSKNSDESQNQSSENSSNSSNETKKYSLNKKGILESKEDINWKYIKQEAEILENSISTLTLDLYEISLNSADILNFNKDYDNLLIQIKNEDKANTLKQLSIIYSYVPKFINNCNKDEEYEIVINTKLNIFNAYAILNEENWDIINKYLLSAKEEFSKLLTNINIKNKNQYIVNKSYIALNSLQNAATNKDKELFLIKYRNLLEDLNNI